MRPDYCPISNEPCQSLCDVPCGKTDYQSLLREALTHFYHDGVPVNPEHPKRITVTKIEKALK